MDGMSFSTQRNWPDADALVYDEGVKARVDHLYDRSKTW
jgi:hypothetical protein